MTISDEDADRIAQAMVRAQGVLNGVTAENAEQRLQELIRSDPEWGRRVTSGDMRANAEFNRLTELKVEGQRARAAAELHAQETSWTKEQALQAAQSGVG